MKIRYMKPSLGTAYGQQTKRSSVEEIVDVLKDSPREFNTIEDANRYARMVYGADAFCLEID